MYQNQHGYIHNCWVNYKTKGIPDESKDSDGTIQCPYLSNMVNILIKNSCLVIFPYILSPKIFNPVLSQLVRQQSRSQVTSPKPAFSKFSEVRTRH